MVLQRLGVCFVVTVATTKRIHLFFPLANPSLGDVTLIVAIVQYCGSDSGLSRQIAPYRQNCGKAGLICCSAAQAMSFLVSPAM